MEEAIKLFDNYCIRKNIQVKKSLQRDFERIEVIMEDASDLQQEI
jgi:hypothetical protein